MEPRFPLPTAPSCHICGQPCTRDITSPGNRNGNANRPYYTCMDGTHSRHFLCWDDYEGITRGNPRCHCNFTSRRSTAYMNAFFSCPAGSCNYNQNAPMGLAYQGAPVVAATANLTRMTPQVVQGQVVATPLQGVASNDHLTVFSPPRVQGQVVASNDYLARTPPQRVQSQIAVFNDHSTAYPPRNTVRAISNRGYMSETGSLASGAQYSDVDSSSPPLEKPQSERKKKHRSCACVLM